jgi:hypothetical protein
MTSETVRKIGFTGSTAVGKLLAEQAAKVGCFMWILAAACTHSVAGVCRSISSFVAVGAVDDLL